MENRKKIYRRDLFKNEKKSVLNHDRWFLDSEDKGKRRSLTKIDQPKKLKNQVSKSKAVLIENKE